MTIRKRLRKEELQVIWNWLEPQITSSMRERIKENWPGFYKNLLHQKLPSTLLGLSIEIQVVLDEMAQRHIKYHTFGDGLPKSYLMEIAQMLDIDTKGRLKWKLLELVLKKIEESK